MIRRTHTLAVALAAATGIAAAGLSAHAQEAPGPEEDRVPDGRWFPDVPAFAPLLAAPLETGLRGAFLIADRPDLPEPTDDSGQPPDDADCCTSDFAGANLEADVALGLRLPVVRLRREDRRGPELVLGFETGIFSRFFMEAPEKDLINADFRVGAPLSARWRRWEGRLELRHMSSHFGDDYVRRFEPPFRQISLEGFELLVARRLGDGWRLYGGGEANFGISDQPGLRAGTERTAARWGLEFDPGWRMSAEEGDPAGRTVWPYVAVDFRIASAADEVAGTGVAGVAFRVRGVGLRLETRGHFGPSSMGQLRLADEVYWGLGLRIEPRG